MSDELMTVVTAVYVNSEGDAESGVSTVTEDFPLDEAIAAAKRMANERFHDYAEDFINVRCFVHVTRLPAPIITHTLAEATLPPQDENDATVHVAITK